MNGRTATSMAEPVRRVPLSLTILVLVGAALLGLIVAVVAHSLRSHSPDAAAVSGARGLLHGQATWPVGTRPAPPITRLHDQSGHSFSLTALRGRTVAMTFFDSHC